MLDPNRAQQVSEVSQAFLLLDAGTGTRACLDHQPSAWVCDGAGLWKPRGVQRSASLVLGTLTVPGRQGQVVSRGRGSRLGRDCTLSRVLSGHRKAAPEQVRSAPGKGVWGCSFTPGRRGI